MKDDLDRYIDRRFEESGKEREAYDKGSQELPRDFQVWSTLLTPA